MTRNRDFYKCSKCGFEWHLTYHDKLRLKEKYGYYPCPKHGCDGVMEYETTLPAY